LQYTVFLLVTLLCAGFKNRSSGRCFMGGD